MMIATTLAVGVVLVSITVLIHYQILRAGAELVPRIGMRGRMRVLVALGAVLVAHFLEIALYAAAFAVMHDRYGFGRLDGALTGGFADFLYYSMTTYTTLGVGDITPVGPIRLLTGMEALNGFVLIGWSASYTYLAMEQFWGDRKG